MATFKDLQNNIAEDLTRDDLTSQIKRAVGDAVKHYETSRFYFNTTRSKTFSTVAGQDTYGAADLAEIPNIIRIDKLFLRDSVSIYPLDRYEPDEFEFIAGNPLVSSGRPTIFTYVDSSVIVWPVPLSVYTLRPHMHFRLPALSQDTDSNAWCNDAEQLIRAHAKLLLYTNLIEDTEGMQRMQLQIPALKALLDYETSARSATGRICGTDF
jgi:hypothetical protein